MSAPKENLEKYIGLKIGNLTIYKAYRDPKFVNFDAVCDCGNLLLRMSKTNFFRRKNYKCDDCLYRERINNVIGKHYNSLTVIRAYTKRIEKHSCNKLFVDCVCVCGNKRNGIAYDKVKAGIVYSCRKCAKSISSMENYISEYLIQHNIEFVFQKKFKDCKDVFELPFDFYLPEYNILIEYDGSQHFQQNHFNNSEADFKTIQKHDNIKTAFAQKQGFILLRFNYKNTKEEIKERLCLLLSTGCESRKND